MSEQAAFWRGVGWALLVVSVLLNVLLFAAFGDTNDALNRYRRESGCAPSCFLVSPEATGNRK